ncbi:Superoxide dismutase [Fe] [Planctomycetes bacterium Pla163]|uniref:Superoxide dismutase n=1 Tax=Rohdeia mirabilis TaxID=2528008 RepID=A0A518D015_9BACT|nr:Superoxide dismutase [Fe] [Planctomycetes bacterium Pla163]
MAFKLPDLPFAADALASKGMSPETFEYHHGKHHNAYVTKLNELIVGTTHENASLEDIIVAADGGLFNQAAQHYNHSFFWNCLSPDDQRGPQGRLADAIDKQWGTLQSFKDDFSAKAAGVFGSGWAWLVRKGDGSLAITQEANAGCPIKSGDTPILTLDVWEHAYYVDHRNARPKFIEGFWTMTNWEFANRNYEA